MNIETIAASLATDDSRKRDGCPFCHHAAVLIAVPGFDTAMACASCVDLVLAKRQHNAN